MTKKQYIRAHPKSHLAQALRENKWADDTQITVSSGTIAPDAKNSKLYEALQQSAKKQYVVGGRLRYATQGHWFAVA